MTTFIAGDDSNFAGSQGKWAAKDVGGVDQDFGIDPGGGPAAHGGTGRTLRWSLALTANFQAGAYHPSGGYAWWGVSAEGSPDTENNAVPIVPVNNVHDVFDLAQTLTGNVWVMYVPSSVRTLDFFGWLEVTVSDTFGNTFNWVSYDSWTFTPNTWVNLLFAGPGGAAWDHSTGWYDGVHDFGSSLIPPLFVTMRIITTWGGGALPSPATVGFQADDYVYISDAHLSNGAVPLSGVAYVARTIALKPKAAAGAPRGTLVTGPQHVRVLLPPT